MIPKQYEINLTHQDAPVFATASKGIAASLFLGFANNGTPVDLSGYTIEIIVARNGATALSVPKDTPNANGSVFTVTGGTVALTIGGNDSKNFTSNAEYGIEVIGSSAGKPQFNFVLTCVWAATPKNP